MKKVIPLIVGLAFLIASGAAFAEDSEVVHVVKKGDTLWDISNKYLKTPWKWPLVWAENEKITNPHLIYPGDKVVILSKDGEVSIKIIPVDKTAGERIFSLDQLNEVKDRSIVLSPDYSTLIYSSKPLKSKGLVAAKADVGDLSSDLDRILVKGMPDVTPGTGLIIKTLMTQVKNEDEEVLGYVYKINGLAKVEKVDDGIATCSVSYNWQEINKNDLVDISRDGVSPVSLKPSQNKSIGNSVILEVWNHCAGGGNGDVIFIDAGSKKGVKPGNVLSLYKPVHVRDGKVDKSINEYMGNAIVIQSVENSSMALITYALVYIEKGYVASGK